MYGCNVNVGCNRRKTQPFILSSSLSTFPNITTPSLYKLPQKNKLSISSCHTKQLETCRNHSRLTSGGATAVSPPYRIINYMYKRLRAKPKRRKEKGNQKSIFGRTSRWDNALILRAIGFCRIHDFNCSKGFSVRYLYEHFYFTSSYQGLVYVSIWIWLYSIFCNVVYYLLS